MLKVEAWHLHYAGGQKPTTRVVDAGDDGPMDRDAGVGLSAGDAADGSACVLSRHGTGMRFDCNECEWLVLSCAPAECRSRSRFS